MAHFATLCLCFYLIGYIHTTSATLPLLESLFWKIDLGVSLGGDFLSTATSCLLGAISTSVCLQKGGAKFTVTPINTNQPGINCLELLWQPSILQTVTTFEDCLDLTGAHWYGGTAIKNFTWPIETWSFASQPYVTGDQLGIINQYAGVQERYWINSKGVGFFVDWDVPLWVGVNERNSNRLCFKSSYLLSPYRNYDNSPLILNYTMCKGNNIKNTHDYMTAEYIRKPLDIPDELLFKFPIWSTWARFKADITQEMVMAFAEEINANEMTKAQLEIDDKWEKHYGDLSFNTETFPNPKQMVTDLMVMGFRTTLWVHPFVNPDSTAVSEGTKRGAFAKTSLLLPAPVYWWNGVGVITDLTSSKGSSWFLERLNSLKTDYGISSFKFDAGESSWLAPLAYKLAEKSGNPSTYSTRYAELAYQIDSDVRHQEVRVGARTQYLPMFVRIMDKDSVWGYENGLRSVIPHVLNFGIIGYPFIIPDMIGGNAYQGLPSIGGNAYQSMPNKELYIRWLEVNTFLPSVQISIAPWQYDTETVNITKKMLQIRNQYFDMFVELANESTKTGAPIIRPLWWIAPDDEVAQKTDSEFLVGNKILVAPVLTDGARKRDIYVPKGVWYDELRNLTLTSPTVGLWLMDYNVELDELAFFREGS
jgi:alpha-glucosidase (family GH31 glycosyl hydrolase)